MRILLDLYCCAGGAGEGYHRAGFKVIGVDKQKHKNYPYQFIQCDAINFLCKHGSEFDGIHASPPCQAWSNASLSQRKKGKEYPELIDITRAELNKTGRPWIIENVPQAPIRPDIVLYGYMFGLKVQRRRHFELSDGFHIPQPHIGKKQGTTINGEYVTIIGQGGWQQHQSQRTDRYVRPWFAKRTIRETWQYTMGIEHHMKDFEISESIPPAYTHFIGIHLRNFLDKHPSHNAERK